MPSRVATHYVLAQADDYLPTRCRSLAISKLSDGSRKEEDVEVLVTSLRLRSPDFVDTRLTPRQLSITKVHCEEERHE